jgi:hypothetical protein
MPLKNSPLARFFVDWDGRRGLDREDDHRFFIPA